MNDHLNELKEKISEEINHRTYSPLLFFIFSAILVEHYEIALYLLDTNSNAMGKISNINAYWVENGSVYGPLSFGGLIFLTWCVVHPASALIWDFVKRLISWIRKTKIHRIPVIPEADYEALKSEYMEERKKLNVEHSEMTVRVEAIKTLLDDRVKEVQNKDDEIRKIKFQFNRDKTTFGNKCKLKIRELRRDQVAEIKVQKELASDAKNELNVALSEMGDIKKNVPRT